MSITDLHICRESISDSAKSSRSNICTCPPEYICVDICPEGVHSLSTLISWQHFPRSTSSRSECGDSEEKSFKSLSGSTLKTVEVEEEKESTTTSTSEFPITKSFAQLNALHYLQIRHVSQLLNFLLSHLVCNEPADPVQFLVDLLEKCISYRDAFGEPPKLFTDDHLRSVYNAFDPFERGYITLAQYKEAMKSLGLENSITPYNPDPPLNEEDCVDESNFTFEAQICLTGNINAMIRIPELWEENRLRWKKQMEKMKLEVAKQESKFGERTTEVLKETKENDSKCSFIDFWKYSQELQVNCEPEQLFLN